MTDREPFCRRWSGSLIMAAAFPVVLVLSYLLALTNHPSSLWLWRDIFHVLP